MIGVPLSEGVTPGCGVVVSTPAAALSSFCIDSTCDGESWLPIQSWALNLRRQGKTLILIHNDGKGGTQRGTSRKEDILDVVIGLRHPSDYKPTQGARFEVHFEKTRGLYGEDVEPFEAALDVVNGRAVWATRRLDDSSPLVRAMAVWALARLLDDAAFHGLRDAHLPCAVHVPAAELAAEVAEGREGIAQAPLTKERVKGV